MNKKLEVREEKIYFPSAGLYITTLSDPEAGPHPVLRLELLAGFSHPRNPRISKTSFSPDCSGETNFLLSSRISLLSQAERPGRWAARQMGVEAVAERAYRDRLEERNLDLRI